MGLVLSQLFRNMNSCPKEFIGRKDNCRDDYKAMKQFLYNMYDTLYSRERMMVVVGILGHQNPSRVVDLQRKGNLDSLLEGRGQLGRERLLG